MLHCQRDSEFFGCEHNMSAPWILFVLVLILQNAYVINGVKRVTCYQCSWEAPDTRELKSPEDEEKHHEHVMSLDVPIHYPVSNPSIYLEKEPTLEDFHSNCKNCTVTEGVCVQWKFISKKRLLNITLMCAFSHVKNGHFEQTMDRGLTKVVKICDDNHCNRSTKTTIENILLTILIIILQISGTWWFWR